MIIKSLKGNTEMDRAIIQSYRRLINEKFCYTEISKTMFRLKKMENSNY